MSRRQLVLLGVTAAVPIACLGTVAGCPSGGPCGWIAAQSDLWWPAALVTPVLVILAVVLSSAVSLGVSVSRASHELAKLQRVPIPPKVADTARAVGIERIACVKDESPVAFCAGPVRPTVYVSEGAITGLLDTELLAVLVHESDHARRREPMRRAVLTSIAAVLVFLPVVGWWAQRQIMWSELRADALAERMVGRPALAGALLVMTAPTGELAAFAGHAELRARRLLGMGIQHPTPSWGMWGATAAHSWLALSLAGCLFEMVAALT